MSGSQDSSLLALPDEITTEQLASGSQNEGSISDAAVERAYRFLQAISAYTKVSVERQLAVTELNRIRAFIRSNPAQRTSSTEKVTAAEDKLSRAKQQETDVTSAVGIRLVQVVRATVQDELEAATAAVVRRTEERCRAEAREEMDTIRREHQVQLAQVRKEAAEVAEAAVARAIEAFEKKRTQAAYLMVAEPAVAVPVAAQPVLASNQHAQEVADLRIAHNRLSEAFEGYTKDAPFKMKKVARQLLEELDGQGGEGSGPGFGRLRSAETLLFEAMTNLNERVVQMENSAAAMAAATSATRASISSVLSSTNSNSEAMTGPSTEAGGQGQGRRNGPSGRLRPENGMAPFWNDPSPAGFSAAVRNGYEADGDVVALLAQIGEMQKLLEWLTEQQAETWALVQLSHYAWGVDRLSVREFVRAWLTGLGEGPASKGSGGPSHRGGAAADGEGDEEDEEEDDEDDDDGGVANLRRSNR